MTLPAGLRARLQTLFPGAAVERVVALRDDETGGGEMKALGYGRPLRVELARGAERFAVVVHTARPDDFGHDRRADRVENLVLAFDTFGAVPHHAPALDVGLVRKDGALVSLADTTEPYLVTRWVDGTLYADDLRRVAADAAASDGDVARADALARVLLEIHAQPGTHAGAYTRAIRDLLGHGEGIFGLVDSYAPDTPAAPPARLRALEEACLAWRWRLRDRTHRLRRTHGDFHPFNIVFAGDAPVLLDASRGSEGDPADDVACLAINYLFFGAVAGSASLRSASGARTPDPTSAALSPDRGHAGWRDGLGRLWHRFWATYLAGDRVDVRDAVAPFFAWRALVLASPRWYPHLAAADRDRILAFAERALAAEQFDPAWGEEAMA